MKYKFPLRIPENRRVTITQGFKSTELVAQYAASGIKNPNGTPITEHSGVDATVGTNVETYGTPLVCPFPTARVYAFDNDPGNGVRGARIQIKHIDSQGNNLIMGGIHLFDLEHKEVYKEGDTLGYLGNKGFVLPAPTPARPFDGSHIHLTINVNGKPEDPLHWFDPQNPFRGPDTGDEKDKSAYYWAIAKLKEIIAGLLKRRTYA